MYLSGGVNVHAHLMDTPLGPLSLTVSNGSLIKSVVYPEFLVVSHSLPTDKQNTDR